MFNFIKKAVLHVKKSAVFSALAGITSTQPIPQAAEIGGINPRAYVPINHQRHSPVVPNHSYSSIVSEKTQSSSPVVQIPKRFESCPITPRNQQNKRNIGTVVNNSFRGDINNPEDGGYLCVYLQDSNIPNKLEEELSKCGLDLNSEKDFTASLIEFDLQLHRLNRKYGNKGLEYIALRLREKGEAFAKSGEDYILSDPNLATEYATIARRFDELANKFYRSANNSNQKSRAA